MVHILTLTHKSSRWLTRKWLQQRRTCWQMFTRCWKLPSTRSRTWDPRWSTNIAWSEMGIAFQLLDIYFVIFFWRFQIFQVLMSGEVMPAEKVPELIAGITTADVQVINQSIPWVLTFYQTTVAHNVHHLSLFFSGCCQEAIISKIEYGSLWKPINSTFPRLPMNPRSIFLAGKFKAFLGIPRTEM